MQAYIIELYLKHLSYFKTLKNCETQRRENMLFERTLCYVEHLLERNLKASLDKINFELNFKFSTEFYEINYIRLIRSHSYAQP